MPALGRPAYWLRVAVLWRGGRALAAAFVLGLLALLLPGVAMAQAGPAPAASTHIAAELVAEGPVAPGGTVTLALPMRPAPGWHGYWLQPGDAGFAMRLDWHLPAGASVGALRYPVPQSLLIAGLMNHVYEQDYAVLVDLRVPAGATPGGRLPLSVNAQWLACSASVCVPEQANLATSIAIAAPGSPVKADPRFDLWRQRLPAPLGAPAHFALAGGSLRLAIPLPARVDLAAPHLFVATDGVVDAAAPQAFSRAGDVLVVRLARAKFAPGSPTSLEAVLALNPGAGTAMGLGFTATPGPVPAEGAPLADGTPPPLPALPLLLLAALAGGLLLNIMPCVFPILSLKALSLARAGESAAHARAEGLAYSAGVVLACVGLGGLLLALRAAGHEVGWAFQLQEPGVVVALLMLAIALTANLAGLYEFSVPGFAQAASSGARNSAFATGLLAAFVATPCTGPFMAGAMGAALLLPPLAGLALFATLGLGIALPFLAIAFVPPLRALLPRPGRWMVWFRKAMALPLGLTALALLWLTGRLGGAGFALACGGFAGALVGVLWWLGRGQARGRAMARVLAAALPGLALAMALVLPRLYHPPARASDDAGEVLPSRPFSGQALEGARASGHPVFAYFTADWCLTCKLNERLAIERASTRDAFAHAGVVVLKGDWTRRDPAITRYLEMMGAAGVPLYVWYPAGGEARKLPQILSAEMLTALPEAKSGASGKIG